MTDRTRYLTKTDFTEWTACEGRAWVAKHEPDRLPPPGDSDVRRRTDGWRLESLARSLFPGGIDIPDHDLTAATETSRPLLAGRTALFQAAVISDSGLAARADILEPIEDGWHLIEIKSSTGDPRSPRDLHKRFLADVTFQTIAFRESGVPITRASVMHIRKGYRRAGEIDPAEMLALTDFTRLVDEAIPNVRAAIDDAQHRLLDSNVPCACNCHRKTRANRCDMFAEFHAEIPEKGTIYTINGIHSDKLRMALDRNVLNLTDWPDDIPLSSKMMQQIELARTGEAIVDEAHLQAFLSAMEPPLWFLDYETFQEAVPRWSGYTPHQQIPFQYSLHVMEADGSQRHHEYLCTERGADPVPGLLEQMTSDIGSGGTVVVWNQGFEQKRNTEMAERHPHHAPFLMSVNQRMRDLAHVVTNGWWVDPGFEGSWSLKSVLPVAAPELLYSDLAIGNGAMASERWMQAYIDDTDRMSAEERDAVADALRRYCHQDTLAMVRIWHHVLDLITRYENQP